MNKKDYHHSDFPPTQEGFIAYVMVFESRTRADAIYWCIRNLKDFDQLEKGVKYDMS